MEDFNKLLNRDQKLAFQESLLRLRESVEKELMKIPGVLHIGVGIKKKQGTLTDIPCFRVYVRRKRSDREIPEAEKIPASIEGIPTDVIEMPQHQKQDDTRKYRPLVGGAQIMNAKWKTVEVEGGTGTQVSYGTLGCFASRNSDSKVVLLSNEHVLKWGDASDGDPIGQPSSPCDCGCCSCGDIAKIGTTVGNHSTVDCGYAVLDDDETYTNSIKDIGYITGTAAPVMNETVKKYGRTTGLTEGTVTDVSGPSLTGGHTYTDQVIVEPKAAHAATGFTQAGDSGSVYVNADNKVIALHMAGDVTSSAGNKIANVEAALGITILATPVPPGVTPHSGHWTSDSEKAPFIDHMLQLEREFMHLGTATEQSYRIMQGRNEIAHLLRHNREVKVIWTRYQGPAFLGHMNKAVTEKTYQVPNEINGISWRSLMIRMSAVLESHGSENLRQLIDSYAADLMQLPPDPKTIKTYLMDKTALKESVPAKLL